MLFLYRSPVAEQRVLARTAPAEGANHHRALEKGQVSTGVQVLSFPTEIWQCVCIIIIKHCQSFVVGHS